MKGSVSERWYDLWVSRLFLRRLEMRPPTFGGGRESVLVSKCRWCESMWKCMNARGEGVGFTRQLSLLPLLPRSG
jgi:hypothetical protein